MNLLLVSEKHGLLIVGVAHLLYIYLLDPSQCTLSDTKPFKKLSINNEEVNSILKLFP